MHLRKHKKSQTEIGLSYGDLTALAGDYTGPTRWQRVLCDGHTRSMEQLRKEIDQYMKYLQVFGEKTFFRSQPCENEALASCARRSFATQRSAMREAYTKHKGDVANLIEAYNLSDQMDSVFDQFETEDGFSHGVWLLAYNYDHFFNQAGIDTDSRYFNCARVSFERVHKLALSIAIEAATLGNKARREKQIKGALVINSYANHILTDMFAAGHVRTPRSLPCGSKKDKYAAAGLAAAMMHDEDNGNGLYVTNKCWHKEWKAYGDGALFAKKNTENRLRMLWAVQQSAEDIVHAYKATTQSDKAASLKRAADVLRLVPDPEQTSNNGQNTCPLWTVEDGKVNIRSPRLQIRNGQFGNGNCTYVPASCPGTLRQLANKRADRPRALAFDNGAGVVSWIGAYENEANNAWGVFSGRCFEVHFENGDRLGGEVFWRYIGDWEYHNIKTSCDRKFGRCSKPSQCVDKKRSCALAGGKVILLKGLVRNSCYCLASVKFCRSKGWKQIALT
jgi:hypothetical protein